ncbi:MAG: type III pantothenate kinase, partial [Gammaproteobacteria bacterium]|nr:type III pantothenate kinase [Gammaproteobacteria bacterium]
MTTLLLDVGNTYLKWGVAGDDGISKTGKIAQQKIRDKGLSVLTTRLPTRIDSAMASNVAGTSFATRLAGLVHAHCNCDLHFAKPVKKAFGLTNSYSRPRQLGVDRWVA